MSPAPNTAKDVFQAALELPSDQRNEMLDEACRDNEALRSQVEALLRVHDEPDSLLDRPRIEIQ